MRPKRPDQFTSCTNEREGDAETVGTSNSASTGGTVKGVRQGGTTLEIEFENGSTLSITTAEETSNVMVRDKDGTMEYAD